MRSFVDPIGSTGGVDDGEAHQSLFHLLVSRGVDRVVDSRLTGGGGISHREWEETREVARKDSWVVAVTYALAERQLQYETSARIHAAVTFGVAFMALLGAFLYALVSVKRPATFSEVDAKRRSRRRQRILEELKACRIRLGRSDYATRSFEDCPICLCPLLRGEVVVASKFCACSENRAFNQQCMVLWLTERLNRRKLCPCCRQPFLPGGARWPEKK